MEDDPAEMTGVSRRECVDLLARHGEDELLDRIYDRYEAYRTKKDIVIVEGTHEGKQEFRLSIVISVLFPSLFKQLCFIHY